MNQQISAYCDESCHLENDRIGPMALGAIWCPQENISSVSHKIKLIKKKHHLPNALEIKWSKVSLSKIDFYLELINYFFSEPSLHFRCLVIPDKGKLNHEQFNHSHDEWYYKMYFLLIKGILSPECAYNVYIDIKDTQGKHKIEKLHEVLCNSAYDFDKTIVKKIQQIHSHEINIMQLTDLLIGAISYFHRKLKTSQGKLQIVEHIKKLSKHNLELSTLPREDKFNLFIWSASNAR